MMLNRRRFLGLGGTKPRATGSSGAPCSFSLEEFYQRRGPQASPPVVIRPTALFYDVETTDVGSGNVRDGCHIASMGGTWMGVVYGVAGLRDAGGPGAHAVCDPSYGATSYQRPGPTRLRRRGRVGPCRRRRGRGGPHAFVRRAGGVGQVTPLDHSQGLFLLSVS